MGGEGGVTGRLLRHARVVVSVREARQLVSGILSARQPVSFDGEGVNLGPSGPMTLLQIGLVTGQIYIFDVMVERNLMYEGGLRELLESSDIVKVRHAFLSVSHSLKTIYGNSFEEIKAAQDFSDEHVVDVTVISIVSVSIIVSLTLTLT